MQNETSVGVDKATAHAMRQDLIRVSRDSEVTSHYIPVVSGQTPKVSGWLKLSLMLNLVLGIYLLSDVVSERIMYSVHVDRLCRVSAGGNVRGYHLGVWSDLPSLREKVGRHVPQNQRVKNAKEICGHTR